MTNHRRRPAQRFNRLPVSLCLAFLSALCAVGCQSEAPAAREYDFSKAEALMEKAVSSTQVPSITVAVSQGGKILWEKAVGFANIEKGIEATPATSYSLASISKPITATGLMILMERGLVDLDKPANDYLGESKLRSYSGNAEEATVLRILNHTSGLATHWHFFYADEPYPRPSMDETIRRYGILIFPPGTQYMYSNLGYGIVDYLIERISGRPYPQFMDEEVFGPLGMTDSAVFLEPGPEERVAQRYSGREKLIPFYDFDHRGASAVYCSARDLLRFGMFHLKDKLSGQKKIIKDKTIDLMKSRRDPEVEANEYRLGWSRSQLAKYEAFSHGGGMPGVSTNLLLIPELDIALVLLCNARFGGLRPIGQAVLEELIPNLAQDMAAARQAGAKPGPKAKPGAKEEPETPEALLGLWEGEIFTHEGKVPVQLLIEKEGGIGFRLIGADPGAEAKLLKPGGQAALREDSVQATFFVKLPMEDVSRIGHRTNLDLRLEGDRLWGAASAYAVNSRFGLPSYISLRRSEKK